ncbi:MAG: hypothetical protein ACTS27_00620 [Phycisphaerales bacterium]
MRRTCAPTVACLLALSLFHAAGPFPAHAQPASDRDPPAAGATLLREGKHLIEAPGLLRLLGEHWVFETVVDGRRRSFTLLPTLKLGELEQVAAARGEGEYRITGKVYVYKNTNYALVDEFASVGERDDLQTEESVTGAPSVADLIREFERTRADRRQAPEGASERRGEAVAVRREGETLTMVRGKIIQNPAGWAYFEPLPKEGALEKDAMATMPIPMLPSLMLEELESLAAFSVQAPVVTLSGEFYAHRGRNYLLPRMYLVERTPTDRDADLPPIAGEVAR